MKVVANEVAGGRGLAQRAQRYALATPQAGYAEQDAAEIYDAATACLRGVVDELKTLGRRPVAVGFSAAMHGLLALDARGEPISPLITWMDRRSAAIADGWRRDGTAAGLYERTGAPVHPMLPLCKLRWLADNDPALFKRAARFAGMKELIVYRWAGEWLVDAGIASATGMFDAQRKAWDDAALEAATVGPERLSSAVPCATQRPILPEVARELGIEGETQLVLGSSDGALANLGSGAVSPELAALTLGTSGAVRVVLPEPSFDLQARTFAYAFDDERWLVGGPTSSAGAVLDWVFALLFPDVPAERRFEEGLRAAQRSPIGARGLTMLPYLSGERAPYWRGDLRGALFGLEFIHDRDDIARAALEAIVFAIFAVHRVLRGLGIEPQALVLSGGVTHSPLIAQTIADVFGIETRISDREEASAFGAAMFAALAIGMLESLDDAVAAVRYPAVYRPEKAGAREYREALERFDAFTSETLARPP
ncbi:MAG: gluconokinase [Candidatus Eremiobacteraeota bacterium]|nr:gluconokinase [Candidatus Eremiobacteraeota bacterium]